MDEIDKSCDHRSCDLNITTSFRSLAPDLELWPTPNLNKVLVLIFVFNQLFGQLSGELVAIWLLLDELLALL